MSNRHLARTIAMQSLYQWDFRSQLKNGLKEAIAHNKAELAPDFDDKNFIEELVRGVTDRLPEVDALIVKYAPEWPLEQITTIDRNILRLGVYELRFSPNVPSRVAINEAIELAKTFGGESSGRFVNGVLGAIYKDMVAKGEEKEVDREPLKREDAEPLPEESALASAGESGEPT